ncbi:hypothetical protein [Candidatus Rariloculus sp.]|uniref:hypothetical protein n=1 Tax=Candidatus Rariloculus sp. TaxID=3101265 RepID=UPI003D0CD66B
MAIIYISDAHKDVAERLARDSTTIADKSIFPTYMHLMAFAAMVGYANGTSCPVDPKDRGPEVDEQVFARHEMDGLVYLLALEATEDCDILRAGKVNEAWRLIESYAEGGFKIIQQWLLDAPGDVDGVDALLSRITEIASEKAKFVTEPLQPRIDF